MQGRSKNQPNRGEREGISQCVGTSKQLCFSKWGAREGRASSCYTLDGCQVWVLSRRSPLWGLQVQGHRPDTWVENECKRKLGAKETRCAVTVGERETGHSWWVWREWLRNKKQEGKILMNLHIGNKEKEGSRMTSKVLARVTTAPCRWLQRLPCLLAPWPPHL